MLSQILLPFLLLNPQAPDCALPYLSQRTGRENCWVEHSLSSNRRLCIPKKLWKEWLKEKSPPLLCVQENAPWKSRALLLNHEKEASEKKTWKTQKLGKLSDRHSNSLFFKLLQNVEGFREKLSALISEYDRLGVMRSLLLDQKTPSTPLPLLRHLGFVHLATASGIHLYALASWIERAVFLISRKIRLPLRTSLGLSRSLSFLTCLGVWILSGCRLGLLRPAFVILIKETSRFAGFQWRHYSPLITALILELFLAFCRASQLAQSGPNSPFSHLAHLSHSGRWVYALAIGGGMIGHRHFSHPHIGLAIGSWVGVAIWEVWNEGTLALATAPLSLLTLPFVCLGIYPLALCSALLLLLGSEGISSELLRWTTVALHGFLMPLIELTLHTGNLWIVSKSHVLAGGVLAVFLTFLSFKTLPRNWFGVFFLILGISGAISVKKPPIIPLSAPKEILAQSVEQLDVGQGDAALIQYSGQKWGLVDTGSFHALSDSAWLQIFTQRGIQQLTWVSLSHLDEDHTGGVLRLTKLIPIECVVTAEAELRTERGIVLSRKLLENGIRIKDWNSGCVPFPVLRPKEGPKDRKANARMSALWIPLLGGGFYLSAGDATQEREQIIAAWAEELAKKQSTQEHTLGPRILKISHHGSKTSTAPVLLQKIQPTEAWISVGVGNSYGHPHPQVIQRLFEAKVPIQRTDLNGHLRTKARLSF